MGAVDRHSLVVRGWQRSGAWAALFGSGAFGADFPVPNVIYAADPTKPPADDVSERPYETIFPLSRRRHIAPVTKYGIGDETKMLDDVLKLTGVALICWEHKKIGDVILPYLAGNQTLPGLPEKWDRARFDVVLRFDRPQAGAQWSFRQLFPRLLDGDSDIPM